ncbi:MAG: NAD(P)-dependent alcohol dehydrogenase [Myxococcota bacterium]
MTMHALVTRSYGPPEVVDWCSIADPIAGPQQIVAEVHATTVNSADARLRAARFPVGMGWMARMALGWSRPRRTVFGVELGGTVVAVGEAVTRFSVGDRVLAMTGARMGAHAERCVLDVDHCVVHLPASIPFDAAVSLPFGGTTALTFLDDFAHLRTGERVLVVGASGAVGTACVQVASLLGAEVTGVCSADNARLVRRLGASTVIDYTTTCLSEVDGVWDVVIDTVGRMKIRDLARLASPQGRIGLVAADLPAMATALAYRLARRQRALVGVARESPDHLERLLTWLGEGRWQPVIDRRLPLALGRAAHTRVDSGRKVGSVVLLCSRGTDSSVA